MANIQHKDIPNADLHEPKGISSAANFQTYVANGAGSGVWTNVPRMVRISANINPAAFGPFGQTQTFTYTGLLTTDTILALNPPEPSFSASGSLIHYLRIPSNDTLEITFRANGSGFSPDPPVGDYVLVVYRP